MEDHDLAAALAAAYDEPSVDDHEARERFVVDDDSKAAWAARRLAAHEAEIARCEALAAEEKARIDAWLADATSGARRQAEWFGNLLVGYAARLHEADPDGPKTRRFVGGEVGRRKNPDAVKVSDEPRFVAWALDAGRLDLVKVSPSVSAVKGHIGRGLAVADGDEAAALVDETTGEIVPGVEMVRGVERYFGKAVG